MQKDNKPSSHCSVAIVGAGSIGTGFAIVHACAGHEVRLFDADARQRASVSGRVSAILDDLAEFGLLDHDATTIAGRINVVPSLDEALPGVVLIHECAPEDPELKRSLVRDLDAASPADAAIASASSAITASEFAEGLPGRSRCLVAHPGNPPFLIPVVEIVPAPFTAPHIADRVSRILTEVGMSPVRVRRELPGFIFNRLQGALLREAYCLVRDDIADVEDIDRVVRDGLGLRWSVVGPFETVDLNTRGGIERHAALLGPAYAAMGKERGQNDPWTPELVQKVTAARRDLLPLRAWAGRVRWRDRRLMALLAARRGRA